MRIRIVANVPSVLARRPRHHVERSAHAGHRPIRRRYRRWAVLRSLSAIEAVLACVITRTACSRRFAQCSQLPISTVDLPLSEFSVSISCRWLRLALVATHLIT